MRSWALAVLIMTGVVAASGCSDGDIERPMPSPTIAATATRTFTAIPATATPTNPPAATATSTSPPAPTATSTQPPAPTATPTFTHSPVPPTATSVPTETPTPAPTDTPTATATPTGPITEDLAISGLPDDVQVLFDDYGFPHVYAPTVQAAIFTQGYLTASTRFWEMDAFRRVAEGRLSEILGRLTLETDVSMRTMFTTRDGRRIEEALWEHISAVDPEVASVLQAYSDGVNAWLADLRAGRNGASMPPEYTDGVLLNETPMSLADWRPQDSMAIARLQAQQLSDSMGDEISFARVIASLPEAIVRDVYRSAPAAPATVLPPPAGGAGAATSNGPPLPPAEAMPNPDLLAQVEALLRQTAAARPFGDATKGVGSNNWIVAPEQSANGFAMLANDPHLALFNPPVWHVIQLDGGNDANGRRYRVNGVIFPGLPGVILGHNDTVAWGATTAGYDVTDVYVEEVTTPVDYPASPRTVTFKGEQVPVLRVEEPFRVKGRANPVIQIIEVVPHHGPMVPDPVINDSTVGLAATGLSFRWTGHEITNDARFLFDLTLMRTVEEFQDALKNFAVGAQNWIYADTDGNIAYSSRTLIPQRPAGVIPYLPVSGKGDAEWLTDEQGNVQWLPVDKIPAAVNPPEGYLASANNDQNGNTLDNDPLNDEVYLAYSAAMGFRQQRILDLLSNAAGVRDDGARMTAEDMSRYQYDHQSLEAARLLPFLFDAAEARSDLVDATMQAALERLQAWAVDKPGSPAFDMVSGLDPHDLRPDIAPRQQPVGDEERIDAVAASIYAVWSSRLPRLVFPDDYAGSGIGSPGGEDATKALLHLLEDVEREEPAFAVHTLGDNGESTLWDDKLTEGLETRDEILLTALARAVDFLEDRFDTADMSQWLWGSLHQVTFQHFVGQAGISSFDLGGFPAPGARDTVNPGGYSLNSNNFGFSGGPSKRFVAILDPAGIRAVNNLPGGINGNPGRPASGPAAAYFNTINPAIHYGDQVAGWINGEPFEYRITRADVEANLERTWNLTPLSGVDAAAR